MKWLRERVQSGELLSGTWLNLGSSLTAEMTGLAGFDWVCIDLEHGAGDHSELVLQLQALSGTPAAPLVRLTWNEPPRFKRALDLGPSGLVIPWVNNADEAKAAVAAMQYPPRGIRGVAKMNRAAGFGGDFDEYFSRASDDLLTVVQIETKEAIDQVDEIAKVDGVDVVFVGPLDLSISLGVPQDFQHAKFNEAVDRVLKATKNAGKAAGIIGFGADSVEKFIEKGFTFIAIGSDGSLVNDGMKKLAQGINQHK